MKTVYVVGGDSSVIRMFKDAGWEAYPYVLDETDLICFTGGHDVSPELYGEANTYSLCNPKRDEQEKEIYDWMLECEVPMVGICRGGQFLNVMNGGKMIQHLGRTISGVVQAVGLSNDEDVNYYLHVDHHQGIIPTSAIQAGIWKPTQFGDILYSGWYPKTKCLCFQPHPEWGHEPTRGLFFQLIEEYIT